MNGSTIYERVVVNQALLLREDLMVEEIKPYVEKDPTLKVSHSSYE